MVCLGLASCRDIGVDGFPASPNGLCPSGFLAQTGRCYRDAPPPDGRIDAVAIAIGSADAAAADRPLEPPDVPGGRTPDAADMAVTPNPALDGPTDLCAGVTCQYANATSTCDPVRGTCTPPVCLESYGDCDGTLGCETRLDSVSRCGGCGTSCQSGEVCVPPGRCACMLGTCGGECVDIRTSAAHCGRCGRPCPAGCAGGSCICPSPSSANLINNGGLDRNTNGWPTFMQGPRLTWRPEDAADCASSGSMVIHNLLDRPNYSQESGWCVRVTPGATYDFGMWMKEVNIVSRDLVPGNLVLDWHSSPDCTGEFFDQAPAEGPERPVEWSPYLGSAQAPGNARSASLKLVVIGGGNQVQVDMLFIGLRPARFFQ